MARGKASFTKRFHSLGDKWTLSSGTVVEEVLYEAGMECVVYKYVSVCNSSLILVTTQNNIAESLPHMHIFFHLVSYFLFFLTSAVHSFMIDMADPWIRGKFSASDWAEMSRDSPSYPSVPDVAVAYLSSFDHVLTLQELETALQTRPSDSESQLVHQGLLDW